MCSFYNQKMLKFYKKKKKVSSPHSPERNLSDGFAHLGLQGRSKGSYGVSDIMLFNLLVTLVRKVLLCSTQWNCGRQRGELTCPRSHS